MEFISNYFLFLAKTATAVVAIAIVVAIIAGTIMRQKKQEGQLSITALDEELTDNADLVLGEILDKKALKKHKKKQKKQDSSKKPCCYVFRFDGDIEASQLKNMREVIDVLMKVVTSKDQVVIVLDSSGGYVPHYGAAASELARLKGVVPTSVVIDKVAASGGYLMAVQADSIVAAPFAIIGSIGVVGQMPNINRLLKRHDVDVELHTSGKYKRTLTMIGENTEAGRAKFKQELQETHDLFKEHVLSARPKLDIEAVATGETWYGKRALEVGLIDEINTSNGYIYEQMKKYRVFELEYELPETLKEKLSGMIRYAIGVFAKRSKTEVLAEA